jgi:hypothetical protein
MIFFDFSYVTLSFMWLIKKKFLLPQLLKTAYSVVVFIWDILRLGFVALISLDIVLVIIVDVGGGEIMICTLR